MITLIACSKNDSSTITKTIDPKTKDEFDNDISLFYVEATKAIGRFYLDYDNAQASDEQKDWLEDEF